MPKGSPSKKLSARKGANHKATAKSIRKTGVKSKSSQKLLKKGDKISKNRASQYSRKKNKGRKPPTGFGQM